MISGIHSLLFGKKRSDHLSADDPGQGTPATLENDYVFVERRHSTQPDQPPMYPSLSPAILPYGISPSLPSLKSDTSDMEITKSYTKTGEPEKSDMLRGVPFVVSSVIRITDEIVNKNSLGFHEIEDKFNTTIYEYDFSLEISLLDEMNSYQP